MRIADFRDEPERAQFLLKGRSEKGKDDPVALQITPLELEEAVVAVKDGPICLPESYQHDVTD